MITIAESALARARPYAQQYVRENRIEGPAGPIVERLVMTYQAAREAKLSHEAAVYVAACETARHGNEKPLPGVFPIPRTARTLLQGVDKNPGALLGFCSAMRARLREEMVATNQSLAVHIADQRYVLAQNRGVCALVGLEREQEQMAAYVRQLFLYDPALTRNPDSGRFPATVLLTGPPGTGKSSLLHYAVSTARDLSKITGKPLRAKHFESTHFSKWLGSSQRALRSVMQSVYDPAGVGIFMIEDVDLLLLHNGDVESKGVAHVEQYLMNMLSGSGETSRSNVLHLFTTNRPELLTDRMVSRMALVQSVNPFTSMGAHAEYFAQKIPSLSDGECAQLAQLSHAANFTGRDLASIVTQAMQQTTRPPTTEEILDSQHNHSLRYGEISAQLVSRLIAERTTARRN